MAEVQRCPDGHDAQAPIGPAERVHESSNDKLALVADTTNAEFYGESISLVYRLKSELVAQHMEALGMGRYQWQIFVVASFGYFTDNFWSQGLAAVQPAVRLEFAGVEHVSMSSIAYYTGMIVGATCWGTSADFVGRRPAFYSTIAVGGVFGAVTAGSNNFVAFCIFWCIIGTAVGGNVPIDAMVLLEFLPGSHQNLLVAQSAFWLLGQLVVAGVSWALLTNFSCSPTADPDSCHRADNMGWRYTLITLGGIALVLAVYRGFFLGLPESPRFLIAHGRDEEAVRAVNRIARRNKRPETLTIEMLNEIDLRCGNVTSAPEEGGWRRGLRRAFDEANSDNFKALFAGKKLARHTMVLWTIWLTVGTGYPLFFNFLPTYLAQKFVQDTSVYLTYRNYCITSVVSFLGPLLAMLAVESRLGYRRTMAATSLVTGIFLFAYTTARSQDQSLAFSCAVGLVGNFMYAVMFAYTPQSFAGPHRGLGTGQASALLRVGGLVASLIGTFTNFTVVPLYVSASLWIVVGLLCFGLPFETAGRSAI